MAKRLISTIITIITIIMVLSLTPVINAEQFEQTVYNFVSADGGKYLNVYAGKDANGTNVCVWDKDGSPEQKFKLVDRGGNVFALYPQSSNGKVVDVNRGSSYSNPLKGGLNVDIWETNDTQAQQFYIDHVSDDLYKIELIALRDYVLTLSGGNKNGGNVTLEKYTGAKNQQWKIMKNESVVKSIHFGETRVNEKVTYQKISDAKKHNVIKTYDLKCTRCGVVYKKGLTETITEAHTTTAVGKTCGKCGFEQAPSPTPVTPVTPVTPAVTPADNTLGNFTLSANKQKFNVDEEAVISWTNSKNVKSYNIQIDIQGGANASYEVKENVVSPYKLKVQEGPYSIIVEAINNDFSLKSNTVSFEGISDGSVKGVVYNTEGLNLNARAKADAKATIIGKIAPNTELIVLSKTDTEFYKVSGKDNTGKTITAYASSKWIKITKGDINKLTVEKTILPVKPTAPKFSVSKTNITLNEKIICSWTKVDNTITYDLHVYKNDTRVMLKSGITSLSTEVSLKDVGSYYAYVYAGNNAGRTQSNVITIMVGNDTDAFNPIWPAPSAYQVTVLSYYYGNASKGSHYTKGLGGVKGSMDIGGNGDVVAIEEGIVTAVVKGYGGGWGNNITIKHNDGNYSFYAHMKDNSITVSQNSKVLKNQKIGVIGSTGKSKGNHLHFEIWNNHKLTAETWTYFREKYISKIKYDADIVSGGSNPITWITWIKNNCNLSGGSYVGK